jgi:hypothetical protein
MMLAFLSETKSSKERETHLLTHIQRFSAHVVPLVGLSGGLWLLWSRDVNLQVLEYNRYYIFVRIQGPDKNTWVLGAIYGDASHKNNYQIWGKK